MASQVKLSGPIFTDPVAPMEHIGRQIDAALADEGVVLVRQYLHDKLKHPTGHYEGQVSTRDTEDGSILTDNGVVYGPWLEGTGSRNQTTHFRGYSSFRKAAQALNDAAEGIANEVIARNIGELTR